MIMIRNIGGDLQGKCEYEVRINHTLIATFCHNRPDGLEECLKLAAKAVARAKWAELHHVIEALQERSDPV